MAALVALGAERTAVMVFLQASLVPQFSGLVAAVVAPAAMGAILAHPVAALRRFTVCLRALPEPQTLVAVAVGVRTMLP